MSSTWSHPRLGVFQHDDMWWRRQIVLPSLESFSYTDAAVRGYPFQPEAFELILQCEAEEEQPSEEMASLAAAIIDNESRLIAKLLEVLWTDLNGRGADSGMWWHGDVTTALETCKELQLSVPTSSAELRWVLEPKNLTIRRDFAPPGAWIGEFNFHAGFDVEHGVGVLTNGVEILGIGYSSDATRFRE